MAATAITGRIKIGLVAALKLHRQFYFVLHRKKHVSADIERWLLDAAAHARPDDTARARLAKIITAVRVRRPG